MTFPISPCKRLTWNKLTRWAKLRREHAGEAELGWSKTKYPEAPRLNSHVIWIEKWKSCKKGKSRENHRRSTWGQWTSFSAREQIYIMGMCHILKGRYTFVLFPSTQYKDSLHYIYDLFGKRRTTKQNKSSQKPWAMIKECEQNVISNNANHYYSVNNLIWFFAPFFQKSFWD